MLENRFTALRVSVWLLWGSGLWMMIDDVADWWFDGEHFAHLLTTVATVACASAIQHARSLLEQHQRQLDGLREAPPRVDG